MTKYAFGMLLAFLTGSCFEQDLEGTPADALLDKELFKTEANAEAALVYVYRSRSWWRYTCYLLEFYGDPIGTGSWSGPANAAANQCWNKSVSPETGQVSGHWNNLWTHASRANNFLAHIDQTPFRDPARKMAAIGEARVNRWIAKGLLAKVLMMAPEPLYGLDRAISLMDEIIGSGQFDLEPLYGDLMMVDNKDNSEGLFVINNVNSATVQDGNNAASLAVPSQIWYRPTWEFYHSFEQWDTRRDVNILRLLITIPPPPLPPVDTIRDDLYLGKLGYDERAINGFGWDSYPQYLIRMGDILLLKAEALAKKDYEANTADIFDLIELVRNRAFQRNAHKVYSAADFNNMDEFWEYLWYERKKEFFYEVHNFFDAKRMGLCQKILGLEPYHEVLPISTYDLALNPNLEQNPGY